MYKKSVGLIVILFLCGYQSTAMADCKAGLTLKPIAEGVRFAELVDAEACKVVSSRYEKYDKKTDKWFEAEKTGEAYKLTVKGESDKEERIEECEGSCAPYDCPNH
jgi:hypothetical protein